MFIAPDLSIASFLVFLGAFALSFLLWVLFKDHDLIVQLLSSFKIRFKDDFILRPRRLVLNLSGRKTYQNGESQCSTLAI